MTDRLKLYNDALLMCGERSLAALTEEREPRRLLDQVWNSDGVKKCLESGQWHFAMRGTRIDYDPDIEPDFGYRRAFSKPTDWILTAGVCSDEFFRVPLVQYFDEAGYWYSELDIIYVRYVSNDDAYGMDLNQWPESFEEFVAAHFASRIVLKLTNGESKFKTILALREKLKKEAKARAAMAEPTSFAAQGSWSRARLRGRVRGNNGNNGGSLIV